MLEIVSMVVLGHILSHIPLIDQVVVMVVVHMMIHLLTTLLLQRDIYIPQTLKLVLQGKLKVEMWALMMFI